MKTNSLNYRSCFAILAGDFQLRVFVAVVGAEEKVQLPRLGVHRQTADKQSPHLCSINSEKKNDQFHFSYAITMFLLHTKQEENLCPMGYQALDFFFLCWDPPYWLLWSRQQPGRLTFSTRTFGRFDPDR